MILNGILIAVPASAIGFAYVSLQLELRRESEFFTDGPIVYETEFLGFSGPIWPFITYFVTPNILMFGDLIRRARRRHRASV